MKRAVASRFLAIIFITALLGSLLSAVFATRGEENWVRQTAIEMCETAAHLYDTYPSAAQLSGILGGYRVTIISPDGVVVDDSDTTADAMENHAARREVQNARKGYVATDARTSQTLGNPYMYAATKTGDGRILRVTYRYGGFVQELLSQTPTFLIAFFLVAIIAIWIAHMFTRRLLLPLERFTDRLALGKYEDIVTDSGYYEIDRIIVRIHGLVEELERSRQQVGLQYEKTNYILSNINEGFILLDQDEKIVLINQSANTILGLKKDMTGSSLVEAIWDRKLEETVQRVIAEHTMAVFDLHVHNTVYSAHVAPVLGKYIDSEGSGVSILLIDVGVERESQRQRSMFFSNASHELKTPITTVMGLTEILESGMLNEEHSSENRERMYARIHAEVKRMNDLINDILSISRLEAGIVLDIPECVDIAQVARDVIAALSPQAEKEQVSIRLHADEVHIMANSRRMRELIDNLVENAIQYNREGGSVTVSIENRGNTAQIKVADTGIGIPHEAQNRVFERFYRIETGPNKVVKGTGLGLSIVKHIVSSMGGEILLQSEVNEGTAITVVLPTGRATA